jgi:hypothetical protein
MYFRNTESVNSSHASLTNSDSNLPNEKGSSPSSSDMKSESAWQKFRKSVSRDFHKKQSEKKELRETQRKFYETLDNRRSSYFKDEIQIWPHKEPDPEKMPSAGFYIPKRKSIRSSQMLFVWDQVHAVEKW